MSKKPWQDRPKQPLEKFEPGLAYRGRSPQEPTRGQRWMARHRLSGATIQGVAFGAAWFFLWLRTDVLLAVLSGILWFAFGAVFWLQATSRVRRWDRSHPPPPPGGRASIGDQGT